MKKMYFIMIVFFFTINNFAYSKDISCAESIQKLCGKSNTPSKCLKSKKSSLPMKCRLEMKKNKELISEMNPDCIKAINTSCKLDLNALQKDQSGYMKKYQKCIVKNKKKIEKACKSVKKYIEKSSSVRQVK